MDTHDHTHDKYKHKHECKKQYKHKHKYNYNYKYKYKIKYKHKYKHKYKQKHKQAQAKAQAQAFQWSIQACFFLVPHLKHMQNWKLRSMKSEECVLDQTYIGWGFYFGTFLYLPTLKLKKSESNFIK